MIHALLIASILAIPTGAGVETWAGAKMRGMLGYDDTQMPLISARIPSSSYPGWGAFPSGSATSAYLFDDAADECLDVVAQFTHSYSEGTAVGCHMHWAPLTTSTNSVTWTMDYTIAGQNVTFPASAQLVATQAGGGVANRHQMVDFAPTITCATCTISTIILAHVCRDANGTTGTDDMVGDVAGLSADCHITLNTFGSALPSTK